MKVILQLTTIDYTDIFPWLVVDHVEDNMVEFDDDNNGPARLGAVGTDEEEGGQTAGFAETGFVSLTPDESNLLATDLHVIGEAILIEVGEKYSLCF